jgi:excisionase family DNA binding protein
MDLESAAAALGVHYQTAYRWVRSGVLPAVKVGSGYELDPEQVASVAEERYRRRPEMAAPAINCTTAAGGLSEALARGDDVAARRIVERLQRDGATPSVICDLIIAPALRQLETQRALGCVVVGEIAVAAEICERLLGLLASPPRGRPRGLAVVASPEGEGHRLPGLMATVALRADRWRVHHLGCGVPAGDLVEFVLAEQPELLVLSLAAAPTASAAMVGAMTGGAVPLLIGGPGASLAQLTADAQRLCTTRRRCSAVAPATASPGSFAPAL